MTNLKIKNLVLLTAMSVLVHFNAQSATFNIPDGDVSALINAINTANSNKEADIINLATNGTYTFASGSEDVYTNNHTTFQGKIALPTIRNDDNSWNTPNTLDLTINGNGSTFIRSSKQDFRFIYVHLYAVVKINGITFRNGVGKHRGGAIFGGWRSQLTVNNCAFYNNKTKGNQGTFEQGGGAIMCASEGSLKITNSQFEDNQSNDHIFSLKGNGGGAVMCLLSNLTIENCTFKNNTSSNMAGAIYTDGGFKDNGKITIKKSKFLNNTSANGSGGLLIYTYNKNEAFIENCHFEGNSCQKGHGGAIYSGGGAITHSGYTNTGNKTKVTIKNCSVINNSSNQYTGGIFINGHHSKIINTTIALNKASGLASALFIGKKRLSFAMENVTIAKNKSSESSVPAVFVAEPGTGNMSIKNTIIANNENKSLNGAAKDKWNVSGENLQYPNDDFGSGITVADPKLTPPAFQALAITKTMALQAGSPAIDSGTGCSPNDQIGQSRVGACDIGACEYNPNGTGFEKVNKKQDLKLYPNPAKEQIILESEILINHIQIIDQTGKTVLQKSIKDKRAVIYINELTKGIYFIHTDNAEVLRFVKN